MSESQEAPPSPERKSRRMSLEDWQSGGGVNGNFRTIPRAEALRKKQMDALEAELMKPRSPWGTCSLPNGIIIPDPQGEGQIRLTEVKLFELTGEEYDVLNAEGTTYYSKVHDVLVACVKGIASKDGKVNITDPRFISQIPYDMMYLDRLFLMYAVRMLAQGKIYPFIEKCPNEKCGMEDLCAVDLGSIAVTPMLDPTTRQYTDSLPSGKSVTWHVLTGSDERLLAEEKDADRKKNSMTRGITVRVDMLDGKPLSNQNMALRTAQIKKLGGSDLQFLWNRFSEVEGDLDTEVELKCQFCRHEFKVETHTRGSGFFFPLLLLNSWKKNSTSI